MCFQFTQYFNCMDTVEQLHLGIVITFQFHFAIEWKTTLKEIV